MKEKILLILGMSVLLSCSELAPEQNEPDLYFSMNQLIDSQINILVSNNYQLKKTASLNGKTDEKVLRPDSSGWLDELKLFRDADINAPAYLGLFEKVPGTGELTSNLQEINYLPINDKIKGVQYIKIFYAENPQDVRKIFVKVTDINPLFQGETLLRLELKRDGENNLVLNSYEITGGQKMIMLDSVEYQIIGEITRL